MKKKANESKKHKKKDITKKNLKQESKIKREKNINEEISKERKYFAIFIIISLTILILFLSSPLLAGISSAAILYVVLKPIYLRLLKIIKRKKISVIIVIVFITFIFLIPFLIIINTAYEELLEMIQNRENIEEFLKHIDLNIEEFDLNLFLQQNYKEIVKTTTDISSFALSTIIIIVVNLFIMFLFLYYLLVENEKLNEMALSILPFTLENSKNLINQFHNTVKSTFMSNGVSAFIQGVMFSVVFYIFGIENIVFWGFVTAILAFLPVIGAQLIWIPLGIYMLVKGETFSGIGLIGSGFYISYGVDTYIRQSVQRQVGKIHPVISLFGLVIGIMHFGITGIIIGPTLISIFILFLKIFKEEYLN